MHALPIVLAALLVALFATSGALAGGPEPAQPVVVKVEEGGFRWEDAGLGAAAGVAGSLLVFALVFASRRPAERTDGKDSSPS